LQFCKLLGESIFFHVKLLAPFGAVEFII